MIKPLELCPVETTARIVGTLSQQLRQLQNTGIVERTVYPDTPPRVAYAITPLGRSLRPLLDAMCHWGKSHSAAMALKKLRASDRLQ